MRVASISRTTPLRSSNHHRISRLSADAWEQRKFAELFYPIPNNSLSRADLNYDNGSVRSVHYGDILVRYGDVLDAQRDTIPYITGANISALESVRLRDGDVLLADAAEDETVGKTVEIQGITGTPVVSGLHTIACRPMIPTAPSYLGHYMNSRAFHDQLLPIMQGTKVSSVSRTSLARTVVSLPTALEEQSRVGAMFTSLDELITLHQRESNDPHGTTRKMTNARSTT